MSPSFREHDADAARAARRSTRRRASHLARAAAWTFTAVVPAAGCGEDLSELVLIIDSDLTFPADARRIEVIAAADGLPTEPLGCGDAPFCAAGDVTDGAALPASVSIVGAGPLALSITARDVSGRALVSRRVATSVQEGERRALAVVLDADCRDVTCDLPTTCIEGTCTASEIDPADLPQFPGAGVYRTPPFASLDAGAKHACASTAEGRMFCWGSNERGQLGAGVVGGVAKTPFEVDAGGPVSAMALGAEHTCVVVGGTVRCAGAYGLADSAVFGEVPGLAEVSSVAAGAHHTCATSPAGTFCFGANDVGQLGDGTTVAPAAPTLVSLPGPATAMALGPTHSCFVTGRAVFCAGSDALGALGNGDDPVDTCGLIPCSPTPTRVAALANVTDVAAGKDFSCARQEDASVWCWGWNVAGQLGLGQRSMTSPVPRVTAQRASALTAGEDHACALDGTVAACWGRGASGQLGRAPAASDPSPTPIDLRVDVLAAAAGGRFSCVLTRGGFARCFGENDASQLGRGVDDPSPSAKPLRVR